MRTGVTEVGTKEVEDVQQSVQYSSLLYFMLKPPSLLTQGFKYNIRSHRRIYSSICIILGNGQCGGIG